MIALSKISKHANPQLWNPLAWLMSFDVFIYAVSFPVVICAVNRQLSVFHYAMPTVISCGGTALIKSFVTEKSFQKKLYDSHFLLITIFDATIWIGYFILWIAGFVPDSIYPIANAVMVVTTIELSCAVRNEQRSRLFPQSDALVEFNNACGVICCLLNALGSGLTLLCAIKSFTLARIIFVIAMTIDNAIAIGIYRWMQKNEIGSQLAQQTA